MLQRIHIATQLWYQIVLKCPLNITNTGICIVIDSTALALSSSNNNNNNTTSKTVENTRENKDNGGINIALPRLRDHITLQSYLNISTSNFISTSNSNNKSHGYIRINTLLIKDISYIHRVLEEIGYT